MSRRFKSMKLAILGSLLFVFSIGNVFAVWNYAAGNINANNAKIEIGLGFAPNYNDKADQNAVMDNIVSVLNDESSGLVAKIKDRIEGPSWWDGTSKQKDSFGSMAVTGGSDVQKETLGDESDVNFLVWCVNYDETTGEETGETTSFENIDYFYIYTTEHNLGNRRTSSYSYGDHYFIPGTNIDESSLIETSLENAENGNYDSVYWVCCVYRTKVTKNTDTGLWDNGIIESGRAPACWYEENQPAGSIHTTQIPSFAHELWQANIDLVFDTSDSDNPIITGHTS